MVRLVRKPTYTVVLAMCNRKIVAFYTTILGGDDCDAIRVLLSVNVVAWVLGSRTIILAGNTWNCVA